MEIEVENIKLKYIVEGEGKDLVLLHGWGQNKEMMLALLNILKDDFKVYAFDIPGFGMSSKPNKVFSVYDYAHFFNKVFKQLKIKKPMMVGHSFGGKISLVYASLFEIDSMVLLAPTAFKQSNKTLKTKVLKWLKKLPLLNIFSELAKKYIGSNDYKKADGIMREILVNTVNNDISLDLQKINVPTVFIFGTNDEAVSLNEAKKMEELVKDSALIIQEGGTHYAYLEFISQTANIIKSLGGCK